MALPITQVDAFTSQRFAGNPAAVCVLRDELPERIMQQVAAEMNLSETAFLVPIDDGYHLRWFTPAIEVALCGHATLAAAHMLWEEGHLPADREARFHTLSGLLIAQRCGERIELDFPATPEEPSAATPELVAALGGALGVAPVHVGRSKYDQLVAVTDEAALRGLTPDFKQLAAVDCRGVIVTARCDSDEFDFVSRYFAPAAGVDEDPVTGSAHCCLGPYWSAQLGRNELVGYQASRRGGVVHVRTAGDRVFLGGQAVTVMRGELLLDD